MSDIPDHLVKRSAYAYRLPGQQWVECNLGRYYEWMAWHKETGSPVEFREVYIDRKDIPHDRADE